MIPLRSDQYEALEELRYLGRKILRFSKDFLAAKAGLNPEQYEALLAIKVLSAAKTVTISQLSQRLQIKHHSAVNIVDRLVERKLIRRQEGKHDRRERHLELTSKGERLIEELAGVHHKELRKQSGKWIKVLKRLQS
jgi:DNA-binding MarR family transcriptional regulator